MRATTRHVLYAFIAILACASANALAQSYPAKPVRMLFGFTAGGAGDVSARILAQKLSESFGQNVFVENRAGAGGAIADEAVARSPADGYTLLYAAGSSAILPALRSKLPYDIERDLAPVCLVVITSFALPLVSAGKLKALGVTSEKRAALLPSVPTLAEAGVTGYSRFGWNGVMAPAAVPKDIVARLNATIVEFGITEAQAGRSAFRMLAHHPDLVKHVYALLTMLSTRNKLPTRLRELMIMRIAWVTGAEYAWFQHYRISTQAGVTPEEIVAVRDWRRSDIFGPADRAVLAAADDTRENGKISDAVWAECEKQLKEPALLVEMVVAIGNWTMFSQLLQSLRVPLEEGGGSWPPDGNAPTAS